MVALCFLGQESDSTPHPEKGADKKKKPKLNAAGWPQRQRRPNGRNTSSGKRRRIPESWRPSKVTSDTDNDDEDNEQDDDSEPDAKGKSRLIAEIIARKRKR